MNQISFSYNNHLTKIENNPIQNIDELNIQKSGLEINKIFFLYSGRKIKPNMNKEKKQKIIKLS